MFETKRIARIAMFGTVFLALFSGTLLAKDRTSSFLMRLFAQCAHLIHYGIHPADDPICSRQSSITLIAVFHRLTAYDKYVPRSFCPRADFNFICRGGLVVWQHNER